MNRLCNAETFTGQLCQEAAAVVVPVLATGGLILQHSEKEYGEGKKGSA